MAAPSQGDRATEPFARGNDHPDADGGVEGSIISHTRLSYFDRDFVPISRRHAGKRLASDIGAFYHHLEGRPRSEKLSIILPTIHPALFSATKALARGDIDGGWKYLHAAQRLELFSLEDDELNALTIVMRIEAEKLNPWRQKAVTELLSFEEGKGQDVIRIFRAAWLRDEHYSNEAHKDGIRRTAALWLACALFIGLAMLLVFAWSGSLYQSMISVNSSSDLFNILLGMTITGFLGATMSAIISTSQLERFARIPEVVYSFRGTILRLLVGPVSAIILFFAVHSNLYSSILNFAAPDGYALLVLAFVAGFTERLVLVIVEAVAGKRS